MKNAQVVKETFMVPRGSGVSKIAPKWTLTYKLQSREASTKKQTNQTVIEKINSS